MAKIKPFYKLNNGNGATLCNTCKVVISEGFTEDLYCKKCDPKQETLEKYEVALKEALLELRKTPMTFEPEQKKLEEVKDLAYYKSNAEEDYLKVPISVLRYISELEQEVERMYSEEDMRNAFDSAREFNSLDGVVDIHIVLPMGGDMSDLQPLHFTFEEFIEQFKKK